MAPPDKLRPSDPRAAHHTVELRGKTYHYMVAQPTVAYQATILLVHGFPDLGFGWRYVVPFLTTLGLRVVVPDLVGFGGTDAPEPLEAYSFRSVAADLAALAAHVAPGEQIVLGGHDWGGLVVWRTAQWHPALVRAVFSVCTPYVPPSPVFVDLDALGAALPNFTYQKHLAGPEVESVVAAGGEPRLRAFLHGMFGARTPAGEPAFDNTRGVLLDNLDALGSSPLLDADEADYYVREYARKGLRGPLNWYRTRRVNFDEERVWLADGAEPPRFEMPALMLSAADDSTLPPKLTEGMEKYFADLSRAVVPGSHWVLLGPWVAAANAEIGTFLKRVLAETKAPKASI